MVERTEPERISSLETAIQHLATKEDVANLRVDVETVRTDLERVRTEVAGVRTELRTEIQINRTEIEGVRTELRTEIESVKTQVATVNGKVDSIQSQLKTWRWLIALIVPSGIAIIGLITKAIVNAAL